MTYGRMCKYYGIKPLTPTQEENISDNEKAIRQCKIDIIDKCVHFRKAIDVMETMAREVEEKDEKEYVDTMVDFRRRMRHIWEEMKEIISDEDC